MPRSLCLLALCLTLLVLNATPTPAAVQPQITDPALDYPVPFADLTAVTVAVGTARGADRLEITFQVSSDITPEGRNLMTGYEFRAQVGKCELIAGWNAFPSVTENAGIPAGSAGAQCGESGREITGTFRITGNTVTAEIPLQDLKGVALGDQMKKLSASTAPGRGLNGDDTRAAGDAASSDKTWVLGRA